MAPTRDVTFSWGFSLCLEKSLLREFRRPPLARCHCPRPTFKGRATLRLAWQGCLNTVPATQRRLSEGVAGPPVPRVLHSGAQLGELCLHPISRMKTVYTLLAVIAVMIEMHALVNRRNQGLGALKRIRHHLSPCRFGARRRKSDDRNVRCCDVADQPPDRRVAAHNICHATLLRGAW
jgi:hypothetical protein